MNLNQVRDALVRRPELEGKAPKSVLREFDSLILDKFSGDTPDKRFRRGATRVAFGLFFAIVATSFVMWVADSYKVGPRLGDGTRTVLVSVFLGGFVTLIGGLFVSLWKSSGARQ